MSDAEGSSGSERYQVMLRELASIYFDILVGTSASHLSQVS